MYNSKTLKMKDHPEIKRVVLAADRSYKKHDVILVVTDSVELTGTFWEGGSRSTYTAVNLATFVSQGAPQYDPPQFGGPRVAPNVTIPEGVAIVKTGIFCGRTGLAFVYVNEANVTKFLPNGEG
jgi:hypothetical protein